MMDVRICLSQHTRTQLLLSRPIAVQGRILFQQMDLLCDLYLHALTYAPTSSHVSAVVQPKVTAFCYLISLNPSLTQTSAACEMPFAEVGAA